MMRARVPGKPQLFSKTTFGLRSFLGASYIKLKYSSASLSYIFHFSNLYCILLSKSTLLFTSEVFFDFSKMPEFFRKDKRSIKINLGFNLIWFRYIVNQSNLYFIYIFRIACWRGQVPLGPGVRTIRRPSSQNFVACRCYLFCASVLWRRRWIYYRICWTFCYSPHFDR